MDNKNTAFFSSCNDDYFKYAASSLLSIRKFVPNARLFVLSRFISAENRKIAKKNGIEIVDLDLSDAFYREYEYPAECYYIFAGPELFYKMGFEYSVYVDGDVLCGSNPLLEQVPCVAGVTANTYRDILGKDLVALSTLLRSESRLDAKRLSSGVVYFNNKSVSKKHLLKKAADAFDYCIQNMVPRKGDDSLFALLQLLLFDSTELLELEAKFNYIPHYTGFRKPPKHIVFFHFSFDKPWKWRPYKHADRRQRIFKKKVRSWRRYLARVSRSTWLNCLPVAAYIPRGLQKIKVRFRDCCLVARGLKYSLRARRKNAAFTVPAYWYRDEASNIYNFGDELTPVLANSLFGFSFSHADINNARLAGVGSILEVAQSKNTGTPLEIWGSGFIKDGPKWDYPPNIHLNLVRGEHTKKRCSTNVPTGDPGLLASVLYKKSGSIDKIGVVIHYADLDLPIVKKIRSDPRFLVINPLSPPDKVAERISCCKLVLSSSLHGLIFAESYKIPCYHIKISNNLTGGTYKFSDYYSGVGKKYIMADTKKMFNDSYLNSLIRNYRPIDNLQKKQRAIVKSFPASKITPPLSVREKLYSIFSRIIHVAFGVALASIFFSCFCVKNDNPFAICNNSPVLIFIIAAVFYVLLKLFIIPLLKRAQANKKIRRGIILLACGGFLVFQGLVVSRLSIIPTEATWDTWEVYTATTELVDTNKMLDGELLYMSNFPLNFFLTKIFQSVLIVSRTLGLTRFFSYYQILMFVNCIAIDLTIVFGVLCVRRLFGKRCTFFGILLFLICSVPLVLYAPICYTDTMSMPLIMASAYFLILAMTSNKKRAFILSLFVGLFIFFGLNVKFTAIILPLAFLLAGLLSHPKRTILIFVGAIISLAPLQLCWNAYSARSLDAQAKVPLTHWIMMGMKGTGGWNGPDYSKITFPAIKNHEDVVSVHIEEIKNRLRDFGPAGYAGFLLKKVGFTWTDGTFYVSEKLNRAPSNPDGILYAIFAKDGSYNSLFVLLADSLYLCALLIMARFVAHGWPKKHFFIVVFELSLVGLFVFLLVWETRSRYLINYLPIMIILLYYALSLAHINRVDDAI